MKTRGKNDFTASSCTQKRRKGKKNVDDRARDRLRRGEEEIAAAASCRRKEAGKQGRLEWSCCTPESSTLARRSANIPAWSARHRTSQRRAPDYDRAPVSRAGPLRCCWCADHRRQVSHNLSAVWGRRATRVQCIGAVVLMVHVCQSSVQWIAIMLSTRMTSCGLLTYVY